MAEPLKDASDVTISVLRRMVREIGMITRRRFLRTEMVSTMRRSLMDTVNRSAMVGPTNSVRYCQVLGRGSPKSPKVH